MDMRALKVSEVNSYIKRVFTNDMILSNLSLEGEISNFNHHYSGHMYFSLKDEKSKIKSIMFKSDNESLKVKLENGLKVIATGYISVYEKEGDYQFYIRHIKESGVGNLYKIFEELKMKLELEGLFNESNKKPIPFMPRKIGVVTSATGAAIKDIINVIQRRFPPTDILIYPTLVQGNEAPKGICEGLNYFDNRDDIDLIITGRGGGAMEELFAFNDEEVARTIYGLKKPVISAVGHEIDFTIADFVADLRAPTPSAAAELAVPELNALKNNIESKYNRLESLILKLINEEKTKVKHCEKDLKYNNPINQLKDKKQDLDNIFKYLDYKMEKQINNRKRNLLHLKNKLDLLNPALGLDRGCGILINDKGKTIKSINEVELNEGINIILKDGTIGSIVTSVEKGGLIDENR